MTSDNLFDTLVSQLIATHLVKYRHCREVARADKQNKGELAMDFSIPSNAHSVTLLVRRSKAHNDVPAESRSLTDAGISLCEDVQPYLEDVVGSLGARFGVPHYYCGPSPAMLITCFILFEPKQMTVHPHLTVTASVKHLQGGRWFAEMLAAKQSRVQIMRTALKDITLWGGEPFGQESGRLYQFLTEEGNESFRIAVADEPAITMALLDKVDDTQLGLAPCVGLLVFRDQGGIIIGAQKLVPSSAQR
ncbi:MAG: hypothetical protein PHI73_00785 [Patescibacteria group bacterium]|nr:hypothetical protein [Patescibacteria group bacterium]